LISYSFSYIKDKSVLENFHVATSFDIMQDDACNIFVFLTKEDYRAARDRMINMVLSTDMSLHFSELAKLKGRLINNGNFYS
jgi:3',5'-cyclic-nucleotide phosphodiesterase